MASKPASTSSTRPKLQRELSKEDIDVETLFMQKEVDNLKDILSGQITFDSNIISNLFNPNEPLYLSPSKDNAAIGKEIDNLKDTLSGQITLDSNIISNLMIPNEQMFLSPKKDKAALGKE